MEDVPSREASWAIPSSSLQGKAPARPRTDAVSRPPRGPRSWPDAAAAYDARRQEGAQFSHLLIVDEAAARIEAVHEVEPLPGGGCRSRLTTRRTGRRTACTRRIEHACVHFPALRGAGTDTGEETTTARERAVRGASGEGRRDDEDTTRQDTAPFVVPGARSTRNWSCSTRLAERDWRGVSHVGRAAAALSGGRFRGRRAPVVLLSFDALCTPAPGDSATGRQAFPSASTAGDSSSRRRPAALRRRVFADEGDPALISGSTTKTTGRR